MTWHVTTSIPIDFKIEKVNDAFDILKSSNERKIVVIDEIVYDLYKSRIPDDLVLLKVKSTESSKDWINANRVLSFFQEAQVKRREPIIAIGGGVLLDLVGFCCSVYRRGVPYIRIPTTLLSIVDASVGAKTAINHFGYRNRVGSFYPPLETIIDSRFVQTQDHREISNGVAEIIKLAIVTDRRLFELLEIDPKALLENKFQNSPVADQIIDRSIEGMINQLKDNLWEKDLERAVDFGHTFSPIVEMKNISNLLHGEAVILDCIFSSCISHNRGMLSKQSLDRIISLINNFSLPTYHKDFSDIDLLYSGLNDVKNHRNGNQHLPLPAGIGEYRFINDFVFSEIELAVKTMESYK
jgi:3-dehydroquinate synthetase